MNTSTNALLSVDVERIDDQITAILAQGETTCDEIEKRYGWLHQTVSSSLRRLRGKGVAVLTGETRKTRTGRPANVYRYGKPEQRALKLNFEQNNNTPVQKLLNRRVVPHTAACDGCGKSARWQYYAIFWNKTYTAAVYCDLCDGK